MVYRVNTRDNVCHVVYDCVFVCAYYTSRSSVYSLVTSCSARTRENSPMETFLFRFTNCIEFNLTSHVTVVTYCSTRTFCDHHLRNYRSGIILWQNAYDLLLQRNE